MGREETAAWWCSIGASEKCSWQGPSRATLVYEAVPQRTISSRIFSIECQHYFPKPFRGASNTK